MRHRMQTYAGHASWAIWGTESPRIDQYVTGDESHANLRLPVDPSVDSLLHGRAVLLGLNPGSAARALHKGLGDWYAFHCGRDVIPAGFRYSNDHFIAEAFRDTGFWGSYMTDLFPTLVDSASPNVEKKVRADRLQDLKWVRENMTALLTELKQLAQDEPPLLICFGEKTTKYAHEFLVDLNSYSADLIVGVDHYSAANGAKHGADPHRYRALVHDVLNTHPRARHLI